MSNKAWIKCDVWSELPVGAWLVKLQDGDYYVAERLDSTNKPVFVGGNFHFDMAEPVAYTTFEKYEEL